MKLTNELNLPPPLVDAVKNDGYDKGDADISVTGLLKPARAAALERVHWDELEEDASDRIFSLMGQVVHGILERADRTGIAERRLSIKIAGWTVSGQMDRYDSSTGLLQDYKIVTAWKFKSDTVPPEYEEQLNCYAHILRAHGHPVNTAEIVGILRDWSKMETLRSSDYPRKQVVRRPVFLWSPDECQRFLEERVKIHQAARAGNLPECTPSEIWQRPTVYALMREGRKSAVKLYEDFGEASTAAGSDPKMSVVTRPGQCVRCESYCSVARFCTQFQGTKAKGEES